MNCTVLSFLPFIYMDGDIAQLARAVALQAIGQGFESPYLHKALFNDKVFIRPIAKKRRKDI